MDTQSAINIINSPKEIKVLFNNSPVWIQRVNGNIASVKFLDNNNESDVPVSGLVKAE